MLKDREVRVIGYKDKKTNGVGQWAEVATAIPELERPSILIVLGGNIETDGKNILRRGTIIFEDNIITLLGEVSEEIRLSVVQFLTKNNDNRKVLT